MLIRPPALTTKSGAQRTPCACSRSATRSSASWLLAAPATIAAAQPRDRLVVEQAPQRARDEHVDLRSQRLVRGSSSARRAAPRAPACARRDRRRPGRAGARAALGDPRADVAEPDHADRADRAASGRAKARSHEARIAASTPSAVSGLGSPEPPRLRGEPGHVLGALGDDAHVAARGADVLGGDVAARRAPRRCRRSRAAPPWRCSEDSDPSAGVMITPLPPPRPRSATAALSVIARDSRSASRTAARESA